MRPIPQMYLDLVSRLEGVRLDAYQDSGGKWTIGYGHTGPEVGPSMQISPDEAQHLLLADSHTAVGKIYSSCDPAAVDRLADHQFSALLSFAFNVGMLAKWQISKDISKGLLDDVPTQLVRFDKICSKGKVTTVPGLLHRRVAEVAFWDTADVEAAAKIMDAAPIQPPPSSVTRDAVTPPAPALPQIAPIARKTNWAGLAVAILGVATASQTGLQQIQHSLDTMGITFAWLPVFDHYSGAAIAMLGVAIMVIRSIDEQLKTQ